MKGRESAEKRRKEVRRQERQRDKASRRKLRREERGVGEGEGDAVTEIGIEASESTSTMALPATTESVAADPAP